MAQSQRHEQSKPTRVLLVDDERTLANVLARAVESKGYQVTVAETLGAAHRALQAAPELVVLDVLLPDGNGLDLLERMRTQGSDAPSRSLQLRPIKVGFSARRSSG